MGETKTDHTHLAGAVRCQVSGFSEEKETEPVVRKQQSIGNTEQ